MRLPNLLDHDTMSEVSQQATSWLPLLNVQCHADSQLFLCSLFAPVCLERPIYPCRSLCNKVSEGRCIYLIFTSLILYLAIGTSNRWSIGLEDCSL